MKVKAKSNYEYGCQMIRKVAFEWYSELKEKGKKDIALLAMSLETEEGREKPEDLIELLGIIGKVSKLQAGVTAKIPGRKK